jgi:hypothetical protein
MRSGMVTFNARHRSLTAAVPFRWLRKATSAAPTRPEVKIADATSTATDTFTISTIEPKNGCGAPSVGIRIAVGETMYVTVAGDAAPAVMVGYAMRR